MENNNFQMLLKNKLDEIKSKINRNKYLEKKFEYKLKDKIFYLLQDLGVGIYGGSILDKILHDDGSKKFYNFYEKYTNDNTISIPNDNDNIYLYDRIILAKPMNCTYNDKNFHSETYLNRNTILNDIDCVINQNIFDILLEKIKKIDNSIKIYTTEYNNFNKYIHIKDPTKIIKSYISIYISALNKYNQISNLLSITEYNDADIDLPIFKPIYFKIDVFIYDYNNSNIFKALNLLSSNADYFCNSLYMINYRLSVNDHITKSIIKPNYESNLIDNNKKCIDMFLKKHLYINNMTSIIKNQILNRYAYPIKCNVVNKRILKMKSKNFKIFNVYNFFENVILKDEICMLCRDNINNIDENVRLICCNSCYHQNCFKEIVYKNKCESCKNCYMCASKINFTYIYINYFT